MIIDPVFHEQAVAVFLTCDEKFVPHAAAAVASIMEHANPADKYDIIVLTDGVQQESVDAALQWFASYPNASLRFFDIGGEVSAIGRDKFYVQGRYPIAVYFRFFAPSLFANYSRILYLDADVVALADVAELFRTPIDGYILAACRDFIFENFLRRHRGRPEAAFAENELGITADDGYFNTGVLLFNLEEARARGLQAHLFEALRRIQCPALPDQDILNSVCKDKAAFLDGVWNAQDWLTDAEESGAKFLQVDAATLDECRRIRERYKILHYSAVKPWQRGYAGGVGRHYWRYLALTPFYDRVLDQWRRDNKIRPLAYVGRLANLSFQLVRCGGMSLFGSAERRMRYRCRYREYRTLFRVHLRQPFLSTTPPVNG